MVKHSTYQMPEKKQSVGSYLGGLMIFAIAGAAVVYLIAEIFKLIFKPLTWIFASSEELAQGDRALENKKLIARIKIRAKYATDRNDPMNQYITRFRDEPTSHLGDPKNDEYQKWFEAWDAGQVLDSELRWAPEVYEYNGGNKHLSTRFCSYLETQVTLHESADFRARTRFLATIRNFYPEFTPRYGTLRQELSLLRQRSDMLAHRVELQSKLGIPVSLAVALDKLNLSPEGIRNRVALAKKYVARDYSPELVEFLVLHEVTDEPTADLAKRLSDMKVSPTVALDHQEGKLSDAEILDIMNCMTTVSNTFGDAMYATDSTGKSRLEEAAEIKVAEVRMAHKRRLREGAWRH